MIVLYTFPTPNGLKISIALEEMGLEYETRVINIGSGDQHTPEYRAINPIGKIPAIVDTDTSPHTTVIESVAILLYLAEKTGKFLPKDSANRLTTLQWLIFQAASFAPPLGQAHHFLHFAPHDGVEIPYAQKRYSDIGKSLYTAINEHLAKNTYFAKDEYTIADMAFYPWVMRGFMTPDMQGITPSDYPHVQRWVDAVGGRSAVQKGMTVPSL